MVNSTTSLNGSYPAVQSTSSMSINKITKDMLEKTAQIGNNAAKLNIKVKETKGNEPPPSTASMSINKVTKETQEKTAQIGNNAAKLNIKVKETKGNEPPPSTASMSINKVTKETQEKTAQIGNNAVARFTGKGGKLNIFA